MKKTIFVMIVLALGVSAQTPAPPAPPAPPAEPGLEIAARALAEANLSMEAELSGSAAKLAAAEAARAASEMQLSRGELERALAGMKASIGPLSGELALLGQTPMPPMPPMPPSMSGWSKRDSEESLYRRGTGALDRRDWERAVEAFNDVIEKKGGRADGALYWKAYALNKLGRRDEALAALSTLRQAHPSSRWVNDARALELEVKQASGQQVSPDKQGDEDLKLMAINSLMGSDPERSVPLLENIIKGNNPPRMKEKALFVLAQSKSPKARETVAQLAKGGANPDLQLKAVEYLGVYGGQDNAKLLGDIYSGSSDPAVKRAVLRGYLISQNKERILAAAKSETNPELRAEAVRLLGAMRAQQELWQLYQGESSADVKRNILHSMAVAGSTDRLADLARSEKDPKLRKEVIQAMGITRSPKASETLLALYGPENDKEVKKTIVAALFVQQNAKALVDLARKESDPEMKRDIVSKLSIMKSKEASDYMLELLK